MMKHLRLSIFVLIVCSAIGATAQENNDKKAIKETISMFFVGLQSGDTTRISKTISADIVLQTAFINSEGNSVKRTSTRSEFLKAVASKKPADSWLEKLLSYEIHIDAPLASVWTPYEFYLNSEFSHCGANSFQLLKRNDNWEIIYLVDSRRKTDCALEN